MASKNTKNLYIYGFRVGTCTQITITRKAYNISCFPFIEESLLRDSQIEKLIATKYYNLIQYNFVFKEKLRTRNLKSISYVNTNTIRLNVHFVGY